MKIELTYDPVGPELMVKVDDQIIDGGDIFGFLYPVRNCILQTWLEPSGSWPGLVSQLRELSRGEEIQLSFRGRRCDYDDLVKVVAPMDEVHTSFVQWESVSENKKRVQDIMQSLAQLLDAPSKNVKQGKLSVPATSKAFLTHFPEQAKRVQEVLKCSQSSWYSRISSSKEFTEADQKAYQCCIVTEEFFSSYESLDQLVKLTRSMRRSPDMILCCFDDVQTCRDYSFYAQQYGNMGFRFEIGNKSNWEKTLYNKYGVAYELNQQLLLFRKVLHIVEECYDQEEKLMARRASLVGSGKKAEQEQLKQKCTWLHTKESYYKDALKLLKESPAEKIARKELVHLGQ